MIRDLSKSFYCAFYGLGQALMRERNFRLQWLMAFMAFLLIYWANFERWIEMLLLTVIVLILSLELINSAIEKACDSHGIEHNALKKRAKDYAAAAVLLASIVSVLVLFTVLNDALEPILLKLVKNLLLLVFWILIFMGNIPICLMRKLSPYALLLSIPNFVLHALFLMVTEGSALFLFLSIFFHLILILASAKRASKAFDHE